MNKINKSENDSRDYFWFELDNKMKVIIVDEKKESMCGALLNINVGSIQEEMEGLAHFLEHMVFMGSEKYPNESNFMDFVRKNGGMTNAMTGDQDTTYYFTINCDKFLNILDMFSWFFINPLLKEDCIDREVNAVDSESNKNLQDDGWIFHEIIKKIMPIDHKINHYTCGDKDTLIDTEEISLRNRVKRFFDTYYSSNLMNLIIFKNKNINTDVLVEQIKNTFGKIVNKNVNLNKTYGDIIEPGKIIKYIPIKTLESINICIQLPTFEDYANSPMHLISYILSSKVDLSLFKIYEEKNIVLNISFNEIYSYDDYSVYVFELNLKEKNDESYYTDEEITDILKIFFDYIKSIKRCDCLEELYEKLKTIDRRNFIIPNNSGQIYTMMTLNDMLLRKIKPENLLDCFTQKQEFKSIEKDFFDILDQINISSTSVVYSSKKFNLKNYEKVKRFETKYTINAIKPTNLDSVKYPIIKPNNFITDKINIIDGVDYFPNTQPLHINNKNYNLIYNFSSSYKDPEVHTYVTLNRKLDIDTYIKSLLFLDTIYTNNDNILSELEAASYNIIFTFNVTGLLIYINSDNNNIDLLYDLFNKIYSDSSERNFNSVYQSIYRNLESFVNEKPIIKVEKLISKKFIKNYYTPYELFESLKKKFSFKECMDTFKNTFNSANVQIFISGNIEKDKAIKSVEKLYTYLNIKENIEIDKKFLNKIKSNYIRKYKNKNNSEKNNVFTIIYRLTYLEKGKGNWNIYIAFSNILNSIASTLYFNNLRTKEQIGYLVHTNIVNIGRYNYGLYGIKFSVQSYKKDSDYIFKRTLEFIKDELKIFIDNITESDFKDYIDGEISELSNDFYNLSELNTYLLRHILDYSYQYDYKKIIIKTLKTFNLDLFKKMFYKFFIDDYKIYSISIDSVYNEYKN